MDKIKQLYEVIASNKRVAVAFGLGVVAERFGFVAKVFDKILSWI